MFRSLAIIAGMLAGINAANAKCLVLGDSIAVGLSGQLRCAHVAKVGMNTAWIARHAPFASYDVAYISAGSNDWHNLTGLAGRLQKLREQVIARRVVWVLPALKGPRAIVSRVAANGDRTISFVAGQDHIHPRSYRALARAARNL